MSSFGMSPQTQQATTGLGSTADTASQRGGGLLQLGGEAIQPGVNFFQTLLGGNRANATALLQPDISRIREGEQNALQSTAQLAPRGGGRSATLFSMPFEANRQIQPLFNNARVAAATTLPDIGLKETTAGTNLFNTAGQNYGREGELGIQQQQLSNKLWSDLGSGLFNLFTTPLSAFTGGIGGKAFGF